jgi:hypothetical protein
MASIQTTKQCSSDIFSLHILNSLLQHIFTWEKCSSLHVISILKGKET